MKVRWTSQAEQDRADILTYIAGDNVRAAIAMDELFGSAAARLANFPMLGKPGQIAETMPVLMPKMTANTMAASASSMVAGNRLSTNSRTGTSKR